MYDFINTALLALIAAGVLWGLSAIAGHLDRGNRLLERSVRLAEERQAQQKIDGA